MEPEEQEQKLQSTQPPEAADENSSAEDTAEEQQRRDIEEIEKMLREGKIGTPQRNVAVSDIKKGRKIKYLPYLYVDRVLDLDVVQEASNWYNQKTTEVFDTAVFLLKCQNITKKKMETARNHFKTLPLKDTLKKLVEEQGEEDFARCLEDYKNGGKPEDLAPRVQEMEANIRQLEASVKSISDSVRDAVVKAFEEAKKEKDVQEKEPEQASAVQELTPEDAAKNKEEQKKQEAEAKEQEERERFARQQAALTRIEKMYANGSLNEAQRALATYHVMSGMEYESLPYLIKGMHLTIDMIPDVRACMENGMENELISQILMQEKITGEKLKIILDCQPNLPEGKELIRLIRESESDEDFKKALLEYKNRNDITWLRAQLDEKEEAFRRLDDHNRKMEEEMEQLKKAFAEQSAEKKTEQPSENGAASPAEPDAAQSAEAAPGTEPKEASAGEKSRGATEDSVSTADAEKSVENSPSGENAPDGKEQIAETNGENRQKEEPGKSVEETVLFTELPEETPPKGEKKKLSFLERFFPSFYHPGRKELIEARQKEREREKQEEEKREEMKHTLDDLYKQDVIDEEAYYIFVELAFKEQRLDRKAATFLVTEHQNGIPFALLAKVVKYVEDSGNWESSAMVLADLIRRQNMLDGKDAPAPAGA